nr:transposase, MuDR, MULE transposase domain protein [Tanacetum cinerariifolium]
MSYIDIYSATSDIVFDEFVSSYRSDELKFEVFFGGCFFFYPLDYVGEHILDLRLPKSKRLSYKEMNDLLLDKTKYGIWKWFYSKRKCSLEEGFNLVENDKEMDKMFQLANLHGTLNFYIGQNPPVFLVDCYFKNLCCVDSDEEVTSMYRSHEKEKKDVSTMASYKSDEIVVEVFFGSCFFFCPLDYPGGKILDLRLLRDCEKMFEQANFHGYLDVYVGHNLQVILLDWYFKNKEVVCESDEEVTSKYSSHKKARKDSSTMSLEEHIVWEQEETQSPSYLRSPHVWKKTSASISKGKVVLDDFEDVADKGKVVLDDFVNMGNGKDVVKNKVKLIEEIKQLDGTAVDSEYMAFFRILRDEDLDKVKSSMKLINDTQEHTREKYAFIAKVKLYRK